MLFRSYRLKQTDLDGKNSYSEVIKVECKRNGLYEIVGIYPNPSRGEVAVDLFLAESGDVKVQLFNAVGQLVSDQQMALKNGFQKFSIDLSGLPPDVYQLNLTTGWSVSTRKIVKM